LVGSSFKLQSELFGFSQLWLRVVPQESDTSTTAETGLYEFPLRSERCRARSRANRQKFLRVFQGKRKVNDEFVFPIQKKRHILILFLLLKPANFKLSAVHPAYGIAENSLMTTSRPNGMVPSFVCFHAMELERGIARALKTTSVLNEIQTINDGVWLVGNGFPLPGIFVKIVDKDTFQLCPPGKVGEIWVSCRKKRRSMQEN
jgi:acyl-CoA synthetase (AMP-forming)/AMP-acid ligase II